MGKRAQEKRLKKEQSRTNSQKPLFDWRIILHPHFWIGVVAFLLVVGYPIVVHSPAYKKFISKPSGETMETQTEKEAIIHTDKGDIVFDLYKQESPKTTDNFILLAKRGYFNGVTFHRVEPGFVIQGGDPKGNGTGGESAWGGKFVEQADPNSDLYKTGYKEGIVAMAKAGNDPAFTGGSQFFIMLNDTALPAEYTIFGRVTSGLDVVRKIAVGDKMNTVEVK